MMKTIDHMALILFGTLLFAIPLSILSAGSNVLRPDVRMTNEVQQVDVAGTSVAVDLMNLLGQGPILIAIGALAAAVLLLANRRKDAFFAIVPVTAAQIANIILKLVFSSPRPSGEFVTVADSSSGFGFPSGHTMTTVVLVGSLAYVLARQSDCRWRRAGTALFVLVIALAMGFSRVYVGAHWPSDILGAYLWGTAFTVLVVISYQMNQPPLLRHVVR